MSDIKTEDLKIIAESMDLEYLDGETFWREPDTKRTYGHTPFDPIKDDADAFKVLEALVERVEHKGGLVEFDGKCVTVTDHEALPVFSFNGDRKSNLRTAIVKAYLSLLRG